MPSDELLAQSRSALRKFRDDVERVGLWKGAWLGVVAIRKEPHWVPFLVKLELTCPGVHFPPESDFFDLTAKETVVRRRWFDLGVAWQVLDELAQETCPSLTRLLELQLEIPKPKNPAAWNYNAQSTRWPGEQLCLFASRTDVAPFYEVFGFDQFNRLSPQLRNQTPPYDSLHDIASHMGFLSGVSADNNNAFSRFEVTAEFPISIGECMYSPGSSSIDLEVEVGADVPLERLAVTLTGPIRARLPGTDLVPRGGPMQERQPIASVSDQTLRLTKSIPSARPEKEVIVAVQFDDFAIGSKKLRLPIQHEFVEYVVGLEAATMPIDEPVSDPDAAPPSGSPPTVSVSSPPSVSPGTGDRARNLGESHPPVDVVVISALQELELEKFGHAVARSNGNDRGSQIKPTPTDPHGYHRYFLQTQDDKTLHIVGGAPTQMGLSASGVLATKMILTFRPRLVVMVGIAAGVEKDGRGFGDILVADQTIDCGAGKMVRDGKKARFHPDSNPIPIDTGLKQRLQMWPQKRAVLDEIPRDWQAMRPNTRLEAHIGPMASQDAVIDDGDYIEAVTEHWRKLIGIEMEAYAVHLACRDTLRAGPKFLCFKSICDFGHAKNDLWQHYAAFTAAEFCVRFLRSEWSDLHLGPSSSIP